MQEESDGLMKSSRKTEDKILGVMPVKQAERLVTFLANCSLPMRPVKDARDYYSSRHKGIDEAGLDAMVAESRPNEYPEQVPDEASAALRKLYADYPEIFGAVSGFDIHGLQTALRRVWDAPDHRHRDWFLFKARDHWREVLLRRFMIEGSQLAQTLDRQEFMTKVKAGMFGPPEVTPIEAALYHLQRIGDLARHCLNSDCPAPYFIATKRWQRYCSPECAVPAQREAKRKWWAENRAKA